MISPSNEEDYRLEMVSPRKNGWSCRWHPLQFLAWMAVFTIAIIYFGFLVLFVPGLYKIPFYVVPVGLLTVQVVTMVAATGINPAEPNFKRKLAELGGVNIVTRPKFSRSQHIHVIENYYCNLCQVKV